MSCHVVQCLTNYFGFEAAALVIWDHARNMAGGCANCGLHCESTLWNMIFPSFAPAGADVTYYNLRWPVAFSAQHMHVDAPAATLAKSQQSSPYVVLHQQVGLQASEGQEGQPSPPPTIIGLSCRPCSATAVSLRNSAQHSTIYVLTKYGCIPHVRIGSLLLTH
jgi:hypothetical protein